jgi:hypothetical protein
MTIKNNKNCKKSTSSKMCETLSCRTSSNATTCTSLSGFGAAAGTTCDAGKVNNV